MARFYYIQLGPFVHATRLPKVITVEGDSHEGTIPAITIIKGNKEIGKFTGVVAWWFHET